MFSALFLSRDVKEMQETVILLNCQVLPLTLFWLLTKAVMESVWSKLLDLYLQQTQALTTNSTTELYKPPASF